MRFEIFGKDGKTPILGFDDWQMYGQPAEKKHWKVGRSAYEIAKSWLPNNEPGIPDDFVTILSEKFGENIFIDKVIVEKKTYFSDTPRGPRNHDLLMYATIGNKKAIIGVEGKERESYDKKLSTKFLEATSPNSNLPSRIDGFCQGILNQQYHEHFKDLHYQFLSGVAGVAVEAKKHGADFCMFIVQQIKTEDTPPKALLENDRAFNDFLKLLDESSSQKIAVEKSSGIWGPFNISGSEIVPSTKLYVGKFNTHR